MFNLLIELHLSLQGKMTTVFRLIVNPERRCLKVMADYHEIDTTALNILLLFFDSLHWQQLKQTATHLTLCHRLPPIHCYFELHFTCTFYLFVAFLMLKARLNLYLEVVRASASRPLPMPVRARVKPALLQLIHPP